MHPVMRLVLGLIGLFVILIGVSLALPKQVIVVRSVVVNAPEQAVYPYLNNLHRFAGWSPWAARDPQMQVTFAGPEEGKGAHLEWASEKPGVGTGKMEITDGTPNQHVDLDVIFNNMEGTSAYDIAPAGSGAKINWSFIYDTGSNPFRRWRGLLLDRLMGGQLHEGLDRLKAQVEADRGPAAAATSSVTPAQQAAPAPAQTGAVPEQPAQAPSSSSQAESTPPAAADTPQPAPQPPAPKKPARRRHF